MKTSKQQTGIKVKKAKGKRVSLRCPLSIERTDLEYNYDTSALQVCMTVENMGGGGLASDTVESAVLVVRLFDADGKIHPCRENEYFAKLLRFGENGLESGARITFRLLPDCDGGVRVEDAEIYISRIRYTDGTVTDYVRGDFFDLPGEGILLTKKFKKNPDAAIEALGAGALYVPEKLTEIVWRCTCGEFSESDACPTCSRNKGELFAAFDALTEPKTKKPPVVAPVPPPPSDPAVSPEPASPAADQTAEYSTVAAKAALAAMEAENGELAENPDAGDDQQEPSAIPPVLPVQDREPDKTRNILLIAITAASVVLLAIVLLLILTLCGRSDSDGGETDATDSPAVTDPVDSDNAAEKVVRTYLAQNDFDNALGYATASGCDQALIDEIYLAAMQYYQQNGQPEKALEWAQKAGNDAYVSAITLQLFHNALNNGEFATAEQLLNSLTEQADAAKAYVDALVAAQKYNDAMAAAEKYGTATTPQMIAEGAVQALLNQNKYDDAIALAEEMNLPSLAITAASSAVDYYISQSNFDKAADYVGMAGNAEKKQAVLNRLTDAQLRRHLPTFFSLLSFEKMQKVHAVSLGSKPTAVAAIDSGGNVYLGDVMIYESIRYTPVLDPETGEPALDPITGEPVYETGYVPAVSVSCNDSAVVILLADGTVRIAEGTSNSYSQTDIDGWTDIVAISASYYHLLGLKSDGTVVAVGSNVYGQCDTAALRDAVAISAGDNHSLILHADGTVTALGYNIAGICDTKDWTDIVAISAGSLHSIGLKADGTVVVKGNCNVTGWSDVVAVFSTATNAVALKSDGTLLCSVNNKVSNLLSEVTDAVWVSVGKQAVTILHRDGTLSTVILSGSTTPKLPAAWRAGVFGIE
ncbi:MAG: hypothetical protein IJX47_00370 [Clostridia bacterium]|nr:hypothetical protein [Clostridia bacterium]